LRKQREDAELARRTIKSTFDERLALAKRLVYGPDFKADEVIPYGEIFKAAAEERDAAAMIAAGSFLLVS